MSENWSKADKAYVDYVVAVHKRWNDMYEKRGWERTLEEDPQKVFDDMDDCIKTTPKS